MIGNQPFYNNSVRRVVAAFGAIFNDVVVRRMRGDGTVVQNIQVPITYAPKQRFYQMSEFSKKDDSTNIQIVWPRMAYEITGMYYDSQRKLNSVNRFTNGIETPRGLEYVHTPVPYNILFSVHIGAKNTDDALQIVEQIVPFFTPHFTVSIFELDTPKISRDVSITLQSVDFSDTYDGDPTQERTIFWTLNFMAIAYIHGPTRESANIKRAYVEMIVNGTQETSVSTETTEAFVNPPEASRDESHKIEIIMETMK